MNTEKVKCNNLDCLADFRTICTHSKYHVRNSSCTIQHKRCGRCVTKFVHQMMKSMENK